jgi:ABC-type multidrug transport system ATPase subunit
VVLALSGIRKAFGSNVVLRDVALKVERGDRVAILGPNGIGKSTLLRIAMGQLDPDAGTVEWGYEAHPGYFAQDHRDQLGGSDATVESWLAAACPGEATGFVRGRLGNVLFERDEVTKKVANLSGGEAARLLFARLGVEQPNVLVLDEPTNHLDLEAIEALVAALEEYDGTLILVSHDRWFVSRLADRIVEISAEGIRDYQGTYEAYVHACGDDHLDVDTVVLKARAEKRERKSKRPEGDEPGAGSGSRSRAARGDRNGATAKPSGRALERRRDSITGRIEKAESRIAEIDRTFADPSFYQAAVPEQLRDLESERNRLLNDVEELVSEWETIEEEIAGSL